MARQRNGGGVIEYATQSGDVVYRIQYRDSSGRQVKETVGRKSEGYTRTMAKAERRARMGKVAKGYKRPDPVPFSVYAAKWFDDMKVERDWTEATTKAYRTAVDRLSQEFGHCKLRDLTAVMVNDYKTRMLSEFGAALVNRTLTVLAMILDRAVEDNLIERDKRPRVKRPTIPAYTPRALTSAEARAVERELAKADDPQIRLAFLTFELLGLRIHELQGLRWRDLSFEENRLRVFKSKTRKGERSVYVPSVLLDEFSEHYQRSYYTHPDNYIFCHPARGTKWRADNRNGYYDSVTAAVKKAGVVGKFRPAHDLRVTSLTEGALAGESPAILMARAGHEDFATTKRYLDLAGVVFKKEAEALAARRMGRLRIVDGGKASGDSFVQEATSSPSLR